METRTNGKTMVTLNMSWVHFSDKKKCNENEAQFCI